MWLFLTFHVGKYSPHGASQFFFVCFSKDVEDFCCEHLEACSWKKIKNLGFIWVYFDINLYMVIFCMYILLVESGRYYNYDPCL